MFMKLVSLLMVCVALAGCSERTVISVDGIEEYCELKEKLAAAESTKEKYGKNIDALLSQLNASQSALATAEGTLGAMTLQVSRLTDERDRYIAHWKPWEGMNLCDYVLASVRDRQVADRDAEIARLKSLPAKVEERVVKVTQAHDHDDSCTACKKMRLDIESGNRILRKNGEQIAALTTQLSQKQVVAPAPTEHCALLINGQKPEDTGDADFIAHWQSFCKERARKNWEEMCEQAAQISAHLHEHGGGIIGLTYLVPGK